MNHGIYGLYIFYCVVSRAENSYLTKSGIMKLYFIFLLSFFEMLCQISFFNDVLIFFDKFFTYFLKFGTNERPENFCVFT